jgi:hypothetical protein
MMQKTTTFTTIFRVKNCYFHYITIRKKNVVLCFYSAYQ